MLLVLAALVGSALAGEASDDAVQITLSVVRVDAVVTDRSGRYVTDLKASDFEIREDGRPQTITNCAYVLTSNLPPGSPADSSEGRQADAGPAAATPLPRATNAGRTLALVVDDLGLSFRGTIEVKRALHTYVDEQLQAGDLAAIVRTSAGFGPLRLTTDKRLLHGAAEELGFQALNRSGVDAFVPVGEHKNVIDALAGARGQKAPAGTAADQLREAMLAGATLDGVRFVVRGLAQLPGRKAVVLFSDGFRFFFDTGHAADPRVSGASRRLVDAANDASVVLYAIDTRGLATLALSAVDDVNTKLGASQVQTADLTQAADARRLQSSESQQALRRMAEETGGFLVRNQNDLSLGVGRVLADQRGYYLIGYEREPAAVTADREHPSFHSIKLRVKRAGLEVRSRAGFSAPR